MRVDKVGDALDVDWSPYAHQSYILKWQGGARRIGAPNELGSDGVYQWVSGFRRVPSAVRRNQHPV